MNSNKYYNEFFELGQQKINFKFYELSLPDDDPVFTLSLAIPNKLAARDSITQAEFDTMMQTGLAQAKRNDSLSVDEAFKQLKAEI